MAVIAGRSARVASRNAGWFMESPDRLCAPNPNNSRSCFASPQPALAAGPASAVGVAEFAIGPDKIADPLLEHLGVGKTAVTLALPDRFVADPDLEDPARARHERNFADVLAEGRQQLLRHPGRPQQPVALGAVGDGDARLAGCFGHGRLRPRSAAPWSRRPPRSWHRRSALRHRPRAWRPGASATAPVPRRPERCSSASR